MATAYEYKLEDQMADAEQAFLRARLYHAELIDIYRYFMPWREPITERSGINGGRSEGARRTDYLFDSTGPSSAFAFVANMKADWMPAFDDFFQLQNGPLYTANDGAERNQALQAITKALHALLMPVRTRCDEMFADLFAGTGALLLSNGDKRAPIRGVAVPTRELALDVGPWGDVERWFWRRNYKAREIEQIWPKGHISDTLAAAIRKDRNSDITVTQYTYWDAPAEDFKLVVWTSETQSSEPPLWTETLQVTPWVTPRMFVVPGEAMGRGLAHLGLPNVRTLNKARELALRAAAFALLGLWTRRNDGVFNPDTAVMAPGAMWKVGSNATGGLGKSIERLDIPSNFDVSSIIIQDEREQLRRVLLDDEMPELSDRVRSPTEIAGRMRRYDRNRGGATTRLALELVTPMVQRGVDIMSQRGMLPKNLSVDQLITEAVVSAPAAAAQRTDKLERMVNYIQIVMGLFGPQAAAIAAKIEEIIPEMARYAGVEERFIRRKTEAEHLKMLVDNAVQAAVEQERKAQKSAPKEPAPAEAPAPGQMYLNGGMN